MSLTREELDIMERLDRWSQQLQRLLRLFEHGTLPAAAVIGALELHNALAGELDSEHRGLNNPRRKPPLTPAERRWYERPIREVHRHLRSTVHVPSEMWFQPLLEAHCCLRGAIDDLNRQHHRLGPAGPATLTNDQEPVVL
jgi:hypothetical protein